MEDKESTDLISFQLPEENSEVVGEIHSPTMRSINDLPTELLVKIFSEYIRTEGQWKFYENVSMVCKKWKDAAVAPLLWDEISYMSLGWDFDRLLKLGEEGLLSTTRYLDLSTWLRGRNFLYETFLSSGTEDRYLLQSLRSAIKPKLQPMDFVKLAPHCHNVKVLDITRNMINRPVLELLTKSWPDVNRLVMDWVTDSNTLFSANTYPESNDTLMLSTLNPVFNNWGQGLKYLNLNRCQFTRDDGIISKVANSCPSLEEFHFLGVGSCFNNMKFRCPIDILQSGCPNLRALTLGHCQFESENIENLTGFRKMKKFTILDCLLDYLTIIQILNSSTELKHLDIDRGIETIADIPSEVMQVLRVKYENDSAEYLKRAVTKWKSTLQIINIRPINFDRFDDLTDVLQAFVQNNQDPVLDTLFCPANRVQLPVVKEAIRVCPKLTRLFVMRYETGGIWYARDREEVERIVNFQ